MIKASWAQRTSKFNASRAAFVACCALVLAALAMVLTGCSEGASSSEGESEGPLIAATVMGQDITEDEVSEYVDSYRNGLQLADDQAWVRWLSEKGITVQDLRVTTIYELAAPIIVSAKAEELGITVDEEAVESQVSALRHSLLVEDDESWDSELERFGMNEEKLRSNFSNKNLEEQVFEQITSDLEPTDTDLRNYAESNMIGAYTKKIGCFYSTDYDSVQAALAFVKEAPSVLEGVEALKERLDETGVEWADVGWDIDAELTSSMKEVVDELEAGQIADEPLTEDDTSYLFYIAEDYTFPSDVSQIDFSDESLRAAVAEYATPWLKDLTGSAWLQQQIEENIVINDMPEGLPYDVELAAESDTEDPESAGSSESADAEEQADVASSDTEDKASSGASSGQAANGQEDAS